MPTTQFHTVDRPADQTIERYEYDLLTGNKTADIDALNRLIKTTDTLDHATTFGNDRVGNRISVTDPLNHPANYVDDTLDPQVIGLSSIAMICRNLRITLNLIKICFHKFLNSLYRTN